jgi:excisionase family DNA binding protein
MERLLDIEEVSEILGVTRATIYSWTSRNRIPHVKLSKRLLKFREKEIMDWIAQKSVATKPKPHAEKKKANPRSKMPSPPQKEYIERIVRNAKEEVLKNS